MSPAASLADLALASLAALLAADGVTATAPAGPGRSATRAPLEACFVGDIIFGRYRPDGRWDPIAGLDGSDPFAPMRTALRADLLVGNLETPLVAALPPMPRPRGRYRFGAAAVHADKLAAAGFTALGLANNHAHDLGRAGAEETPAILAARGIVPLGASVADGPAIRVETVERAGWRIGFLTVTTHRNVPQRPGVRELPHVRTSELGSLAAPLVARARAQHDLLVVLVHWGDEYAETPERRQVRAAHALVDAGADLVIGHHPHVLQGIERHGRGLIAYSLGNFLFENARPVPRMTGVLRVRFNPTDGGATLAEARFHPAVITNFPRKRPVPARGGAGHEVRDRLAAASGALGARLDRDGDDLVLALPDRAAPARRGRAAPGDEAIAGRSAMRPRRLD